MPLVDLTEYKIAKQYLADYPTISKMLSEMEQQLAKYAYYLPIYRTVNAITDAQLLLSAHHTKAKHILEQP